MYCTCGQCLIYSESRRKFNRLRLDALSIANHVIKNGATHARHGKTEVQKEYHQAWNAWKRCCKKVYSQGEHFTGILDRFLWDPVCRESQLAVGWTEQKCKEWDEIAKEDHTCKLNPEEERRYKGQWYLTLNKTGKNGPRKLRSDYRAAVIMKNRLHHESGEPIEEPIHPGQQRRTRWGLLVQRSHWSTYRMAILAFNFIVVVRIRMELEVTSQIFFLLESLFVTVSFVYSW